MKPAHQLLEVLLKPFCGREHVAVCSSGTAALHLALEVLGLPPGSEVLVPAYAMIAVPRAVVLAGLRPRFLDSSPVEPNVPVTYHSPFTEHTAAQIVVHTYGRPAVVYTPPEVKVIEDLAECHGLKPGAGSIGCWSFYQNKVLRGYEGGAVACRSEAEAERVRSLRSLGFGPEHDYRHQPRGHNYRMSEPHAAVLIDRFASHYGDAEVMRLRARTLDTFVPETWRLPPREFPWVYDLLLPEWVTREVTLGLVKRLNALLNVTARPGFLPMPSQPEFYWEDQALARRTFPNAYKYSDRLLYLTIHPALVRMEDVVRGIEFLRKEVL